MRIAIDCRRILPGMSGLGTYTLELVRELVPLCIERNHTVELFILPSYQSCFSAGLKRTGKLIETCVSIPVENHIRGDWWKHITLPRYLRRTACDVFHDPAYQIPIFGCPTKQVVTVHDLSPFRYPETNTLKYNIYWRYMTTNAIRRADRIISVSEYTKREISDKFAGSDDRIAVILEAAASVFSPGEIDSGLSKRLGITGRYLLTAAKYEPRKNLVRCLEAFAEVLTRYQQPVQLVIAGSAGWKSQAVEAALLRLNLEHRVIRTGYLERSDLISLMRGAYGLVVPSLYEGFGLPVLEGMACGTAVICSDVASLSEIAGGATGLFDPLRSDSIAEVMLRLLRDPEWHDELKRKGMERAGQFSWARTAEETLAVYESLV